jgi:hypothetical protein
MAKPRQRTRRTQGSQLQYNGSGSSRRENIAKKHECDAGVQNSRLVTDVSSRKDSQLKPVFERKLPDPRTIQRIDDLQCLEPGLWNQVAGLGLADSIPT